MMDQEKKPKLRCSDFIFRFRHCLAFITILVFLMIYGFNSYAQWYRNGTISGESVVSYYSMTSPYTLFNSPGFLAFCNQNNIDYSKLGNAAFAGFDGQYVSDSQLEDGSTYSFPTSVNDVSVVGDRYHVFCLNASNPSYKYSYSFVPSGDMAIVAMSGQSNKYIVSDSPFSVFVYQDSSNYFSYDINTLSSNGFYCMNMGETIFLTDLNLFYASSDGSTGFTNISYNSTDFSFSANNVNMNYMLIDGCIVDPNGPSVDPDSPIISSEGQYFTYAGVDVEFVGLSNSSGFTANYTFSLNSYMQNHPEDYTVITDYQISATYDGTTEVFSYEDYIDGEALVYNSGKYSQVLGFNMFFNNIETFNDFLKRIWRVGIGASDSSGYIDGSVISYGSGSSGGSRAFGRFNYGINELFQSVIPHLRIDTVTKIRFNGSPMQESGNLRAYYDFVSKQSKILENGISANNNPAPSGDLTNYNPYITPNTSGSGGTGALNTASAIIQSGAIQIQSQGGFQLSAQGWTDYGNFYQSAANALKDLATGSGDFPQVVQAAGSFLPSAIWGLVLAGVATSVCIGLWSGVRNH